MDTVFLKCEDSVQTPRTHTNVRGMAAHQQSQYLKGGDRIPLSKLLVRLVQSVSSGFG